MEGTIYSSEFAPDRYFDSLLGISMHYRFNAHGGLVGMLGAQCEAGSPLAESLDDPRGVRATLGYRWSF